MLFNPLLLSVVKESLKNIKNLKKSERERIPNVFSSKLLVLIVNMPSKSSPKINFKFLSDKRYLIHIKKVNLWNKNSTTIITSKCCVFGSLVLRLRFSVHFYVILSKWSTFFLINKEFVNKIAINDTVPLKFNKILHSPNHIKFNVHSFKRGPSQRFENV